MAKELRSFSVKVKCQDGKLRMHRPNLENRSRGIVSVCVEGRRISVTGNVTDLFFTPDQETKNGRYFNEKL